MHLDNTRAALTRNTLMNLRTHTDTHCYHWWTGSDYGKCLYYGHVLLSGVSLYTVHC